MSQRNWSNAFAVGLTLGGGLAVVLLVWVIGLNYCPNGPCYHGGYPGEGPSENEYWVPFATGPDTTSRFEPEDRKGHPDYYQRQDLRAQETMARATNAIVLLTTVSVVLGLVGAFFLLWTLFETRRTADATIETLRADRAYVAYDDIHAEWWFGTVGIPEGATPSGTVMPIGMSIAVQFKNFGKTPARNVRIASIKDSRASSDGAPEPLTLPKIKELAATVPKRSLDDGIFLAPEQSSGTALYHLSFEDIEDVRKGIKRLFILSGCIYHDVFEDEQWAAIGTKFEFLASVDVMKGVVWGDPRKYIRVSKSISGNVNT